MEENFLPLSKDFSKHEQQAGHLVAESAERQQKLVVFLLMLSIINKKSQSKALTFLKFTAHLLTMTNDVNAGNVFILSQHDYAAKSNLNANYNTFFSCFVCFKLKDGF